MNARLILKSTILLSIVFSSCMSKKTVILEGEYYVPRKMDFYAVYEMSESKLNELITYSENVNLDTLSNENRYLVELIRHAVDEEVIRLPFIRIKTTDDEDIMLYMPEQKFETFDSLNFSEIRRNIVKVNVVAKAEDISYKETKAFKLNRFKEINITRK
ncbi:hypothetical protein [Carboxylicivirga marina]|uniref:hypothetical protein n=1 Tax=Carboxylicivirga marina TaxID=2800988 RepID=UPI0025961658|nr:hypothetical protein [uncultured Carboxylicivirga sp.]